MTSPFTRPFNQEIVRRKKWPNKESTIDNRSNPNTAFCVHQVVYLSWELPNVSIFIFMNDSRARVKMTVSRVTRFEVSDACRMIRKISNIQRNWWHVSHLEKESRPLWSDNTGSTKRIEYKKRRARGRTAVVVLQEKNRKKREKKGMTLWFVDSLHKAKGRKKEEEE